jgi:hypothetical protein
VGGNILTMVMILAPSLPLVYRAMFTDPNIAINNAMACRVFCDIKFGHVFSYSMTVHSLPTFIAKSSGMGSGVTNRKHHGLDTFELTTTGILQSGEATVHKNGVHITKSTQQFQGAEDPFQVSLDSGPDKTLYVHDCE